MNLVVYLLILLAMVCILWIVLVAPRRKSPSVLSALTGWRFAHRGYHDESLGLPENSLGAFTRAVKEGFGAELDVHLSKDGRLVVHHDESLKRMCGADQRICDLTADELAEFRLGSTQQRIPFLEEVLPLFDGKAPLVIELKHCGRNAPRLCSAVMNLLDSYNGEYCIESFDPRVLLWLKKHRPEIARGQLAENYLRHKADLNPVLAFLLQNLLLNFLTRPDFIAYRVDDWNDRSFTLCRRFYGATVFGWTIHNKAEQSKVEADGGMLIFENYDPRI